MKTHTLSRRVAFTLIEMLVVIAIIGILVAMLVPGFSKARERARRVQCTAHLRELYTASVNYATDSNGRFPYAASHEHSEMTIRNRRLVRVWSKRTGWVDWHDWDSHEGDAYPSDMPSLETRWWGDWAIESIENGSLWAYTGDRRIYICPTFLWHMSNDADIPSEDPDYRDAHRSYVMNASVSHFNMGSAGSAAGGMSRRMLFADACYDLTAIDTSGMNPVPEWDLNNEGDTPEHTPQSETSRFFFLQTDGMLQHEYESIGHWHGGKANVVFLDGHTELVPYEQTANICTGRWTTARAIR